MSNSTQTSRDRENREHQSRQQNDQQDYQQSGNRQQNQQYSGQPQGQNGSPYGQGGQYSEYQGNYPQGGYGGFQHRPEGGVGQAYLQGIDNRYGQQNYGGQQGFPQPNYGGPTFDSREYQQYTPQASQYGSNAGQYGQSQQGPHSGRGPKGYKRSDERIKEDVCQCLCDHGHIDASNIEVSCKEGEVTLSGTCCDRQTKRMAEDACESVSGISDVNNQLKVKKSDDKTDSSSNSKKSSSARAS